MKHRNNIILIFIAIFTFFGAFYFYRQIEEFYMKHGQIIPLSNEAEPVRNWKDYNLVMHALGAIHGHVDTNTKEALIENYHRGSRVFEIDLHWTTDERLIAIHPTRVLRRITDKETVTSYDILHNNFFKERDLTPLTFGDLAILMVEFPDIFIITDTKNIDKETVQNQFAYIYRVANEIDRRILNRIIPQLYNFDMYLYIEEIYSFKEYILTLYQIPRIENSSIFNFLTKHPRVTVVSLPFNSERLNLEFIQTLRAMSVLTYVHTLSNMAEITRLYNMGVWGFYTPFITEDYIRRNGLLRFNASN